MQRFLLSGYFNWLVPYEALPWLLVVGLPQSCPADVWNFVWQFDISVEAHGHQALGC